MTNKKICRLIKSVRKNTQWVKFKLPDTREIKILIRDDATGDKRKSKLVIDCPIETKIESEFDDVDGNN